MNEKKNMNSLVLRLNFLIIDNFSFDLKCYLEVVKNEEQKLKTFHFTFSITRKNVN